MCEKYNGWTNYETWNVSLWLDNDEGSYHYWKEIAEEIYRESAAGESYASQTRKQAAAYAFGKRLQDETEENAPSDLQGTYADLLSASLSAVNWYEIGEHWIDCVADEIEKEEAEEAREEAEENEGA